MEWTEKRNQKMLERNQVHFQVSDKSGGRKCTNAGNTCQRPKTVKL